MTGFWGYAWVGIWWGAVYFHCAFGIALIFGLLRTIHFCHGDIAVLAVLLACAITPRVGLAAGIILGVGVAGVVGIVVERVVYAPLRRRRGDALGSLLASVALSIVIGASCLLVWGDGVRRLTPLPFGLDGDVLSIGPLPALQVLAVASALLVFAGGQILLYRSRLGLSFRASADDAELAAVSGVSARRAIQAVFLLAGAVAALGLCWLSADQGLNPRFGLGLSFRAFVASVAGAALAGGPSIGGTLAGAMILGVGEKLLSGYVSSAFEDSLAYVVAIVLLLGAPPIRAWVEKRKATRVLAATSAGGAA